MDLNSKKVVELKEIAKTRGAKIPPKTIKSGIIDILVESGIKNIGTDSPKKSKSKPKTNTNTNTDAEAETETKTKAPHLHKLNKKLEMAFVITTYKDKLAKFTEETEDEEILELLADDIDNFIENKFFKPDDSDKCLKTEDYKKYVNEYGGIEALVEYTSKTKDSSIYKMNLDDLYRTLAVFLYKKDTVDRKKTETTKLLVNKIKKHILSKDKEKKTPAKKASAKKAPVKKPKSKAEKKANDSDEEDEEDEVDDNESEEEIEEIEEEEDSDNE